VQTNANLSCGVTFAPQPIRVAHVNQDVVQKSTENSLSSRRKVGPGRKSESRLDLERPVAK
jgi:hypothetical protein